MVTCESSATWDRIGLLCYSHRGKMLVSCDPTFVGAYKNKPVCVCEIHESTRTQNLLWNTRLLHTLAFSVTESQEGLDKISSCPHVGGGNSQLGG